MGKNVAVFVDVANIFYAAKAAGVDIDYVTLLRSASAGRDLVRAYAYTGLDPDNENQRNFHSFLARNGYRVVSKDIRKYGDGKVKANLDIELVGYRRRRLHHRGCRSGGRLQPDGRLHRPGHEHRHHGGDRHHRLRRFATLRPHLRDPTAEHPQRAGRAWWRDVRVTAGGQFHRHGNALHSMSV